MSKKVWYTYDDIHRLIAKMATEIQAAGVHYDAMIAIGGGGFIPARMLRCYLDVPIYAVTTEYYANESSAETLDTIRTVQWLDPIPESLAGKNILVVDEVDDSRVTLGFVLRRLQQQGFGRIGVAVVHNKIKEKSDSLPPNIDYFAGVEVADWWINYPWDANDIDEHNRLAAQSQNG